MVYKLTILAVNLEAIQHGGHRLVDPDKDPVPIWVILRMGVDRNPTNGTLRLSLACGPIVETHPAEGVLAGPEPNRVLEDVAADDTQQFLHEFCDPVPAHEAIHVEAHRLVEDLIG